MRLTRARRTKIARTLAAALAGGTLLGTCQTRFRDSVVGASRDYLLSTLLNPVTVVEAILAATEESELP
jgi:hypothetical protein